MAANQRSKSSDKTVEKMFKINTLRQVASSRSILKLKIAVPNTKSTTPEVGYYDTAEISKKIKISKGNFIEIKSSKPS